MEVTEFRGQLDLANGRRATFLYTGGTLLVLGLSGEEATAIVGGLGKTPSVTSSPPTLSGADVVKLVAALPASSPAIGTPTGPKPASTPIAPAAAHVEPAVPKPAPATPTKAKRAAAVAAPAPDAPKAAQSEPAAAPKEEPKPAEEPARDQPAAQEAPKADAAPAPAPSSNGANGHAAAAPEATAPTATPANNDEALAAILSADGPLPPDFAAARTIREILSYLQGVGVTKIDQLIDVCVRAQPRHPVLKRVEDVKERVSRACATMGIE